MSYAETGPIIEDWTTKNAILLKKEDGFPSRRFFYVSSPFGETFQIVIEPEKDGIVRIDAHLIESKSDEQAHFIWKIQKSQMRNGLELSLSSVQAWFRRQMV